MQEDFIIQGNITTLRNAIPIKFVHRKNIDKQENHLLHLNNHLEIYVFVEGNHKYIVENNIYELKRGDIILISPREVHKALPMEECLYERFYLLLDEHCLDGIETNPLPQILNVLSKTGNLISPPTEEREQALKLLYELSQEIKNGPRATVGTLGTVLKLLDIYLRQLSKNQPTPNNISAVPELLEKILLCVTENAADIQSTAQVARELGISQQYLSTYFSKHLGTSLKIYIQAKKVALAKNLLDQGADVTRACFESGFNDCSYFIKVFKKHTSVTPMQYRKKLCK